MALDAVVKIVKVGLQLANRSSPEVGAVAQRQTELLG
jgi:hypothetical protein